MLKKFRQCAGAIVFNKNGNVFLGNRNDVSGNHWQFPQGGIEPNESPQDAAKRELFEETSISSVKLIFVCSEPYRYEFTEEIKKNFQKRGIFSDGQDIYFALFFFTGENDEINVQTTQPEFKDYTWESLDFAVQNVVSFKKQAYVNMAQHFEPLIEHYLREIS